METDYTALASRVAARAEVLGCLILSRDGLVLGSFPPGGEHDVTPAWLRFSAVGEPQRGFMSFTDQLWAYARHGEYAAFAVALPSARAGILLDLLEQALMEVDEAHYLREAVRAPAKVNLTFPGPREELVIERADEEAAPVTPPPPAGEAVPGRPDAPPPEVAESSDDEVPEEDHAHREDAPSGEGDETPPAPGHGWSQEDIDRVALAREFSQLLQENPKPVEEAP